MELVHGGDVAGYRRCFGREPLDFSASLNPLGMPEGVAEAARRAIASSVSYPDPLCRDLAAALARSLDMPERFLFIGSGAVDVIYRLVQARRPRAALLPVPAFAEYGKALRTASCRVVAHCLRKEAGFRLEEDVLPKIDRTIDMMFLCQPNNPTGKLTDPALMDKILLRAGDCGTLLVVDECFCRFVDCPEKTSLLRRAENHSHLFIVDSFTKLYGMPGLRLGYGVSADAGLVESLHDAGPPWAVSTAAQAAGLAALGETKYVRRSRELVFTQKKILADGLCGLGCEVIGADANYIFFRFAGRGLYEQLLEQGIVIRDCANFTGLEAGYYRVAVRTGEDNARLLEAMKSCV